MLVIDKEPGPTSNAVLQSVRRILGRPKAGHGGTLDPGAAGVLLVCIGEGTKIIPYLAGLEKEYEGSMRFGEETDTCDRWGTVSATRPTEHLERETVEGHMVAFTGNIRQRPPMYSALKVQGKRLYDMARRGETVRREAREVTVGEFTPLGWKGLELSFRVRCGSGVYVRALCRDLGRACGSAAHMTALTRTAVGTFRREEGLTLPRLEALPREKLPLIGLVRALAHLPALAVSEEEAADLRHGRRIVPREEPAGAAEGGPVSLVDGEGELVAVATWAGPGLPMPIERGFS